MNIYDDWDIQRHYRNDPTLYVITMSRSCSLQAHADVQLTQRSIRDFTYLYIAVIVETKVEVYGSIGTQLAVLRCEQQTYAVLVCSAALKLQRWRMKP